MKHFNCNSLHQIQFQVSDCMGKFANVDVSWCDVKPVCLCSLKGRLVYVNYGRIEDFDVLTKDFSVNVSGSIGIARYGRIFRGDKVALSLSLHRLTAIRHLPAFIILRLYLLQCCTQSTRLRHMSTCGIS